MRILLIYLAIHLVLIYRYMDVYISGYYFLEIIPLSIIAICYYNHPNIVINQTVNTFKFFIIFAIIGILLVLPLVFMVYYIYGLNILLIYIIWVLVRYILFIYLFTRIVKQIIYMPINRDSKIEWIKLGVRLSILLIV